MTTPIIIFAVITLASLFYSANQHGKPKEGNNNFWISLVSATITWTLIAWMLDWQLI